MRAMLLAAALMFGVGGDVAAAPQKRADVENEVQTRVRLRAALHRALNAEVMSLKPSRLEGFYSARLHDGESVLVDRDGAYLITGDLYELRADGVSNLSELDHARWRLAKMAEIKRSDMIVFSPTGATKASITVFTDVDCGYCRRMHQEVPILNRKGIEVRYLAFPRAGVGSDTYRKMVSAWCASDPRDSITRLKNGRSIPNKLCSDNPVADQLQFGKLLGVRGTPALLTDSGAMVPGYVPAEKLARRLGVK